MSAEEIQDLKDNYKRKITRFKERLAGKDSELRILLELTNAINYNESTLDILAKFETFVKEELKIEKLVLFAKYKRWRVILDYNVEDKELDGFDIERDLLHIEDITSVNSLGEIFKNFDMVVPVYHGDRPLAYLIVGDIVEDEVGVSSIIKHLNFMKLLTNIIVSAIENRRLAKEALKQEQEKQKLIAKQKEMLEIQVAERTKDLRSEKEESERLLHNILPVSIAEELKKKGYTSAQSFKEVTMLFTDFKGFTAQSALITPENLVAELNDIFKGFDAIMGEFGVEKIKTIGDAYMAVCGLPEERDDHALLCIRAAQAMLDFLAERGKTAKIKWEMRVGIHSGALVAGVVGTKKFTYDVWGDTVNTAARMESNGEPGRINVSKQTSEIVKDYFEFEPRGFIEAKGKGKIEMFFIGKSKKKLKKEKKVIEKASIEDVEKFVFDKLEKELPEGLSYHGLHHTKDMYESAIEIAEQENIEGNDLNLIRVAALFHDSGFTATYEDHEEAGCKIAKKELPAFGYSKDEIEAVCGMIMTTKVPQTAKTDLERIICDADLDYLGTDKFERIGNTLLEELNGRGAGLDTMKWNELQIGFLEKHQYYTKTCKKLRDPVKQQHLEMLKGLVAQEAE
ncbi:MAG: HD domain-containing protein [Flavobacteriales bacterium]|nr:HD domain-containing protein [Flavobacteriales bacterium]